MGECQSCLNNNEDEIIVAVESAKTKAGDIVEGGI